ncbi:MAG: AIR synthase related protein, partial [Gemmatimonadota bacterium]|nr:AIR synthase related protein [Gemmatimonadota bacterium]
MPNGMDAGLAVGAETERIRAFLGAAGEAARDDGDPDGTIVEIGPGDDAAAFLPSPGERIVVSVDASVEGIHFRRAWMTWETIGYRAAAAALSDLAAMAAAPLGLLVSAALPPEHGIETASAIGAGVGEALAGSGGTLLGGDLVASPGPVFLDVTVLGRASAPIRRRGARPGDVLWVTGHLG